MYVSFHRFLLDSWFRFVYTEDDALRLRGIMRVEWKLRSSPY